ncbi:rhomboid family intramembrane serine protease [Halostagnicola kamekurae]|uniref:Membrane associated serine protease, rhomboid family n=1 Tax=Halostagnicola kamekurae TaxID=619731 RepID=A0A1I6PNM0_9EURY|nr:rhomboid family intramembrane serine protease [Halostagnicola kamekurae]SFS41791.1 Membrane associated serine protease, rhomboid family [Halostagnicola kamekurae]
MSTRSGTESPILELLVVFVLVFVVQFLTSILGLMGGLFVLAAPLSNDPWTIVTSVYAHDGVGHLLSNSIALVLFGWPVARATSRLRFHAFFLLTGAIAGVSQVLVLSGLGSGGATPGVLGASGAVFALLGYLLAGNRLSSGVASVIDVPDWVTYAVFFVVAVVVTLTTFAPGVALVAHFTGLLLGLLAGRARVLHVESSTQRDRPSL